MSTVVVELYDALRKAGVDEESARDAAAAVVPANALGNLATKNDISELSLATKNDISELRQATKSDISELRLATKNDISELSLATKNEFSEIRREMSELKTELIKWNVGAIAIMTAIFAAIARLT